MKLDCRFERVLIEASPMVSDVYSHQALGIDTEKKKKCIAKSIHTRVMGWYVLN